ncbi:hypothetical protein THASP1DRAFT_22521 [Thamnocephalis sphaerospora]|uniref:Uncharacterized protein n=1 Tax=Thamnocephalis sphaerospora TaxID=78915 RepID=A0A4P9XTY8_9FUNG|nr:hypothetical protein THASP1DRAFT_22521 [Thamnocephalis sphaerospora]|eukprot:RKP09658.1 hypothetical protein THASP1DRAFT_22521 [Thamnocephalis sphaerospora]
MRSTLVPCATVIGALASLSLISFFVGALSIPPLARSITANVSSSSVTRPLQPGSTATPDDFAALKAHSNGQFQLYPDFAIMQPAGTHIVYHKDSVGRTFAADMLTFDGELVREVILLQSTDSGGLFYVDITDYFQGQRVNGVTTAIQLDYDDADEQVTQRCKCYLAAKRQVVYAKQHEAMEWRKSTFCAWSPGHLRVALFQPI